MSAKEALAQAQLAIESGRALFREGVVAECHAYMALALRSLLDAWALSDGAQEDSARTPSERREQALSSLERAKYPHIVRLSGAYRAVLGEAPRAVRSGAMLGERDFEWIWPEVDRLHRFITRRAAPAETRRRLRIRLALVLVPIVLVLAMVFSLQRVPPAVLAASASYPGPYPPENAVDGLETTEWLLPDGATGWIDVPLAAPGRVHSVTLVNCHNGGYLDRGSAKVRVTAFHNDQIVASVDGAFTKISGERAALTLPLDRRNITSVRAEVLSHFGLGGGFAEVEVR
ncbi:MAG TPA: discoidin domain-containing protein [Polyangiaceae bacterium]